MGGGGGPDLQAEQGVIPGPALRELLTFIAVISFRKVTLMGVNSTVAGESFGLKLFQSALFLKAQRKNGSYHRGKILPGLGHQARRLEELLDDLVSTRVSALARRALS